MIKRRRKSNGKCIFYNVRYGFKENLFNIKYIRQDYSYDELCNLYCVPICSHMTNVCKCKDIFSWKEKLRASRRRAGRLVHKWRRVWQLYKPRSEAGKEGNVKEVSKPDQRLSLDYGISHAFKITDRIGIC